MELLISEDDRISYIKKRAELSAMESAFSVILNDYVRSRGCVLKDSQAEGRAWQVKLKSGQQVIVDNFSCISEDVQGQRENFSIRYNEEKGGVVAEFKNKIEVIITNRDIQEVTEPDYPELKTETLTDFIKRSEK